MLLWLVQNRQGRGVVNLVGIKKLTVDYFQFHYLAERSASKMLGLRPRSVLKVVLWLQNGPWCSSILEANQQAASSTSTKRISWIQFLK